MDSRKTELMEREQVSGYQGQKWKLSESTNFHSVFFFFAEPSGLLDLSSVTQDGIQAFGSESTEF